MMGARGDNLRAALDQCQQSDGATSALESEHVVLGASLSLYAAPLGHLEISAGDFAEPLHARIWQAIQRRRAANLPHDAALVFQDLRLDEDLLSLGGQAYLADMVAKSPAWTAESHAGIIADRAARRRLIGVLDDARQSVLGDLSKPAFDHLATTNAAISEIIAGAAPTESSLVDARSAAIQRVAEIDEERRHGRPRGLMTGLRCFDVRMRGLRPGWLVVLAGRSSMGKTALARSTAMATAMRNPEQMIVYFTVEMDRGEISERTLSEMSFLYGRSSAIEYRNMGGDTLLAEEVDRIRDLATRVPDNFKLEDTPSLSIEFIRRRLYALKRKGPIGAAFIDYLQIMQRPTGGSGNDASVLQQMTTALKNLARELGICIVLLSQLNREVEKRPGNRPQMSDLRESGAIEQDANSVLLVFREHYYLVRDEAKRREDPIAWEIACEEAYRVMEVIGAKNRGGATFTEKQTYFAEFDHVEDPA